MYSRSPFPPEVTTIKTFHGFDSETPRFRRKHAPPDRKLMKKMRGALRAHLRASTAPKGASPSTAPHKVSMHQREIPCCAVRGVPPVEEMRSLSFAPPLNSSRLDLVTFVCTPVHVGPKE